MDVSEWKELDEFLFARAMEHDSPKLLFRLTAMAESCGVPHDVLAWTAEWYFRPETAGSGKRTTPCGGTNGAACRCDVSEVRRCAGDSNHGR